MTSLKYTVERERTFSIDETFRLPKLPGSLLPQRLLTATYYDTSHHDLSYGGIALCHRIEGDTGTWRLTLPLLYARQEVAVPGTVSVPPPELSSLLVIHLNKRSLRPAATLRIRRTGIRARVGATLADVTVDQVSVIRNGRAMETFLELKLVQMGDRDDGVSDLERRLRDAGARDHDGRPTVHRALSLPPAGPGPSPAPDAPLFQHIRWALGRHLWWLRAHDPGARLGREPECVHQMRVAARQLKAVLHAARPLLREGWERSLQAELSWLIELLGPARDLDVQCAYFTDEAGRLNARDRRVLAPFMAHLHTQRRAIHEVLLSGLNSARYFHAARLIRDAAQHPSFVDSDASLTDLARREYKALRKAIRRAGADPSAVQMHRIRIKTKRARYATALAAHAIGKPADRFMSKARKLQDLLGRHQDAVQAERHVRAFLKHSTSVRAAFVGGLLVERQRQRRRSVRKKFRRVGKRVLQRGRDMWD